MNGQVLFIVPDTSPLVLSGDEKDLTFRKELIYTGDFVKKTKEREQHFSVNTPLLDHWHSTAMSMIKNGVEIPVPSEHSEEPERRRGTLVKTERGINAKGLPALFGFIKFKDKSAADLAKTANVSIFTDTEYTDGKGNNYYYPIKHVALTDYPVIPGLGKFESLAASLVEGHKTMPLDARKLAKKLKIADSVSDNDLETEIEKAIDVALSSGNGNGSGSGSGSASASATTAPANPPAVAASQVSLSVVNLVKDSRETKIDKLVSERRCTPAVAAELKKEFCSVDNLKLSLSSCGEQTTKDGFDATVKALSLNEPYLKSGEQSGPQVMELSQSDLSDATKNPMIKNAQERAAAAKR
jgi:hypothetical protein